MGFCAHAHNCQFKGLLFVVSMENIADYNFPVIIPPLSTGTKFIQEKG
jgi:hypothetical protein